jgi:hypothetical protein
MADVLVLYKTFILLNYTDYLNHRHDPNDPMVRHVT